MNVKASRTRIDRVRRAGFARLIIKLVVAFAAVATVFVLAQLPPRQEKVPTGAAPPVNVAVMPVTAEPQFPDTFDLPAFVEPNQVVTVAAEVAGRVEWIGPREGAAVRAGDLLMRLNTDLLQAEYERVQAQVKSDRTEFERQEGLVQGGAAPSKDLDQAATDLAISTAQLQEIRARLARTNIVAPLSGVLNNLPVEQGEYVQPGTPVADIVDADTVKVVVSIPERDVPFFAAGGAADVLADIKGRQRTFKGTITFISELADERTRSTRMEIALRNEDGLLHSGQIVQVRLTRQILEDAILIPLLAVIPMEEGYAVYVAVASQAERRDVEFDIIKGDRIQVTSGLQPGDQLIVAGHRFVAPGQNIRVISQEPESK